MTDCTILISNHNSYEAIQLCIESIRRYTDKPRITVYDDSSSNGMDIEYLRKANADGWLELIEGRRLVSNKDFDKSRCGHHAEFFHGRTLNILTASCVTRYAVLMDCDVEILGYGWLDDLLAPLMEDEKNLMVCDLWPKRVGSANYVMPTHKLYFGALDMERYHDGMIVDWIPRPLDRAQEPMLSLFAEYYPPAEKCKGRTNWGRFNADLVRGDPGSMLWLKMHTDNPRGYVATPWPQGMESKFYHYVHVAIEGNHYTNTGNGLGRFKNEKFTLMRENLKRLRAGMDPGKRP